MAIIEGVGPNVSSQFNELRTAARFPVIELKSVYGYPTSEILWKLLE